jgi:hypothetical protein
VQPPGSQEDGHWARMTRELRENSAVMNSRQALEDLSVDRVVAGGPCVDAGQESSSHREQASPQRLPVLDDPASELLEDGAAAERVPEDDLEGLGDDGMRQLVDSVESPLDPDPLLEEATEAFGTAADVRQARELIDELWFEISRHTGRIHLHRAADGSQPLNVQVESADHAQLAADVWAAKSDDCGYKTWKNAMAGVEKFVIPGLPERCVVLSGAKRQLLQVIGEFHRLPRRQRQHIFGLVVRPPLIDCVPAVAGSKRSRRRFVPTQELLAPSIFGASRRKVFIRTRYRDLELEQGLDDDGRPLCQACGSMCAFGGQDPPRPQPHRRSVDLNDVMLDGRQPPDLSRPLVLDQVHLRLAVPAEGRGAEGGRRAGRGAVRELRPGRQGPREAPPGDVFLAIFVVAVGSLTVVWR